MHFVRFKFFFTKRDPDDLTSRYDMAAASWHSSLQANHYISAYQQVIDDALSCSQFSPAQAPLSVLDAGAGTGGFSLALSYRLNNELNFDLLDPSAAMLNIAQQQLRYNGYSCSLIHAPIDALQNAHKRYDLILCGHVIEHCADGHAALQTLSRVLSDNGIIILAVSRPHWCSRLIQMIWGHQAYEKATFIEMLRSSGFSRASATRFKKAPPKFTSYGYFARKSAGGNSTSRNSKTIKG